MDMSAYKDKVYVKFRTGVGGTGSQWDSIIATSFKRDISHNTKYQSVSRPLPNTYIIHETLVLKTQAYESTNLILSTFTLSSKNLHNTHQEKIPSSIISWR